MRLGHPNTNYQILSHRSTSLDSGRSLDWRRSVFAPPTLEEFDTSSQTLCWQIPAARFRPEHLFSLKQAVELYEFYQSQIAECDREILAQLAGFDATDASGNGPPASVDEALQRMSGVDLTGIDGIDTTSAVKISAPTPSATQGRGS